MKLVIATDHRGLTLKNALLERLREAGHQVLDLGSHGPESVDYPDYAISLAEQVARGEVERGILICGTGIGMSIAANKVQGAMAALVYDEVSLRLSREHNNANILVLPGNWLEIDTAALWVERWLSLPFAGGRHVPRVARIEAYDNRRGPVPEAAD